MTSLSDLVQQAGSSDMKGLYPGVATAKVVDNKDPDGMGRVQLTYPWLGVENKTDWVRISTPMAGKERGLFILPEVGEEVLVSFDKGDLNHPYMLGALWGLDAKPPEKNEDGKNNLRLFKSRSGHTLIFDDDTENKKPKVELTTSAGHKMTFDDKDGEEKVQVVTKAGHKLILDDKSGSEKISIVDKTGSNSIVIDSAKKQINIKADTKIIMESKYIELNASGNKVVIDGNGSSISIKSSAKLSLESAQLDAKASATCNVQGAQTTVKGDATCTVQGGAMTSVKGGIVQIN